MSGRGKGGKGLGKEITSSITKPAIRRLARRHRTRKSESFPGKRFDAVNTEHTKRTVTAIRGVCSEAPGTYL